ncbi:MAG TPA: hypothetical protein PLA87_19765 [Pseudomonadota bacterium]|nr:hypothetical protein [Pseudomonadota bacterium]
MKNSCRVRLRALGAFGWLWLLLGALLIGEGAGGLALSRAAVAGGAVGPGGAPALPAPTPLRWSFRIDVPDLSRGLAEVTWTLTGFDASQPLRVCGDMDGAERFVTRIERLAFAPKDSVLATPPGARPLPKDGDCWRVDGVDPAGVVLRYFYDLRELARHHGSPDYGERIGQTWIVNDETILLRPDPLPHQQPDGVPAASREREPTIDVEFRLPAGAEVAVPWLPLPGPGRRYRMDAAQYDGGTYMLLGALEKLGELQLPHAQVLLYAVPQPRKLSDAALRDWMLAATTQIDRFYGPLMPKRVQVLLVPAAGSTRAGVFGTVVRPLLPSAVIYFGADCERVDLAEEWVAVHELFHIGNPKVWRKIPWLVEGFTTYYQDVLRGRAGMLPAAETWGDLWDGFRRFCQPSGGRSLAEESAQLRYTYRYTRVYWGGACLAFFADVAIRKHSRGKQSLDDVLRALRAQSLTSSLTEEEALTALEAASGGHELGALLREKRALPVEKLLRQLGVEPTGDSTVRLREDAPLSALRRAMF